MVRALAAATVIALVGAMATTDVRQDRETPDWYVELCARVSTC